MYKRTAKSQNRKLLKTHDYVSAMGQPISLHKPNQIPSLSRKRKQHTCFPTPGGTKALDRCAELGKAKDKQIYEQSLQNLGRPTVDHLKKLGVI